MQQEVHHQGTCEKCNFLWAVQGLLHQKIWGWSPAIWILVSLLILLILICVLVWEPLICNRWEVNPALYFLSVTNTINYTSTPCQNLENLLNSSYISKKNFYYSPKIRNTKEGSPGCYPGLKDDVQGSRLFLASYSATPGKWLLSLALQDDCCASRHYFYMPASRKREGQSVSPVLYIQVT